MLHTNTPFFVLPEKLNVLYVVRDSTYNVIPDYISFAEDDWREIWFGGDFNRGELDIPIAPNTPGDYILTIYFNGYFVTEAPFTVLDT